MKKRNKKLSIGQSYFRSFLVLTVLLIGIMGTVWIYTKISEFNAQANLLRKELLEKEKEKAINNVNNATSFITYENAFAEEKLKRKIKQLVEHAHSIALYIYNQNKGKISDKEIQKQIFTALNPLKLDNKKRYIFIVSMKGVAIFYPKNTKLHKSIGKEIINFKDRNGQYIVRKEINQMLKQDEAFNIAGRKNLSDNTNSFNPSTKISYIKKFKPYNWYMGTVAYVEDILAELKTETINKITQSANGNNLFIYNSDGVCKFHSESRKSIGKNYRNYSDKYRNHNIDSLLRYTQNSPAKFYSYHSSKNGEKETYITYIKEWNWMIGSGFYLNHIEEKITKARKKLNSEINSNILQIIIGILIAIIAFTITANFVARKMNKNFKLFNNFFKQASNQSNKIDVEKQQFSDFAEMAVTINEMIDIRTQKEIELKKAIEKAKESDRLKSAFLANMSHEIRTPMNAIIGFSELLLDETVPNETRQQFFGHIKNSGNSLLQLINDIIDISKIESGKLQISKNLYSINTLFDEIEHTFNKIKTQREKNELKLIFKKGLSDENSVVFTDHLRLKQILSNLIENAIKFTPEEGSITIQYHKKEQFIIFNVIDTGIGIHPKQQEIIFSRFRQADDSHTRKYGGTGLGLSISKRLIELLGGKIWVNSTPKQGSTFSICIPYIKSNTKVDITLNIEKKYELPNLTGKKILIIDDIEANVLLLKQILGNTNATITTTTNGKKAINLSKQTDYDIVLLDLQMPETDGYEVAKQIRKYKPDIKIIAQTAQNITNNTDNISDIEFNGYVTKPIIANNIIQLIEKII